MVGGLPEPTNFKETLAQKSRVYEALILRHVIMRYGRENIGFLWVIVEPMLLCLGVMVIWSVSKPGTEHGVQAAAIVYTGYMPLTLWRHQSNLVYWLRASKFFTQFRGITMEDALFSRLFMEFITVTAATIIVHLVLNTLGVLPDIHDIGLMIQGWMLMGALGTAGGILIASISEVSEVTDKFIPPLQYFLIPFSGCFYMLNWMPDSVRESLLYVPFQHAFETFRAGYFGPNVKTYGQPLYGYACALVAAACGLLIFNRVKDHVHE
jgi:capsular polysaccharide transport system permease protein